jgi:hypothetical protein
MKLFSALALACLPLLAAESHAATLSFVKK